MRTKIATTALLASLTVAGVALAPAVSAAPQHTAVQAAPAAAPGFYVGGTWKLYQSNGPVVTMNVSQDSAGTLYGSASCCGTPGTIRSGRVDGTGIYFVIAWSNGALGRYTGNLGPDRRLSGYTFDINNPSSQANWNTSRTF
ncbi:hypothetical protein OG601_39180 [Streptomyces sp. NBC_01239]|uniref:hypothetical protein n=1 Tax=Streptomyces sp. NBC_01239 TaxID=2903792 RepID=UPI00224F885A|nr:hypothetical protein [Streptomyces sp. NBC_01239]MCX4816629.1 hypothetical protein [Streptomyces sp. NBC_01239]